MYKRLLAVLSDITFILYLLAILKVSFVGVNPNFYKGIMDF